MPIHKLQKIEPNKEIEDCPGSSAVYPDRGYSNVDFDAAKELSVGAVMTKLFAYTTYIAAKYFLHGVMIFMIRIVLACSAVILLCFV